MSEGKATTPAPAVWIEAARPRTLALALAGVILGIMLAAAEGTVRWSVATLTLVTAILLQILSNLANDYGDSLHGADHVRRQGPRRAVQSGLIARDAMRRAIILVVLLAMACGLALVWLAFGTEGLLLLAVFVFLGAAAIWAAIAYTASARPYGYAGLGDLFVFLFFGLVAVGGTFFLQTQQLTAAVLLPAGSVGLFSVAVLNVNNIRDLESDREAGKRSLPVRLGPRAARIYHWALLGSGTLLAFLYVIVEYYSPWQFLFLLSLPLLVRNGLAVWHGRTAAELDPLLRQMSLTTLLFVLTFGFGQLLP